MPVPDESRGEVVFKIVYAGPEGAGKTRSLAGVHRLLGTGCEPAVSAQTSCDRTLVFGYRPERPVMVRGLRARFQMITVPGHVHYAATWQLALRGADGIVFVADSTPSRMAANADALKSTFLALQQNGTQLANVPFVFQCNKRDIPNPCPTSEIERVLNVLQPKAPMVESCADTGEGLLPALEALSQKMLGRYGGAAEAPSPAQRRVDPTEFAVAS
jgi:signal recognition particle receptor subunit beta